MNGRQEDDGECCPVDEWSNFPEEFRKGFLERSLERHREVHDGVAGSLGPWLPLRPVFLDHTHYAQVAAVSARLMRLVLECCLRRARTAGELQEVLGVPREQTPLLRRDEPLGDRLLVSARPDIVYRSGIPCFVEFNIDGALGGTLQADLLASRFRGIAGPGEGPWAICAPPSAVDARFAEIRSSLDLPEGSHVVIPVFRNGAAPGLEESRVFLDWLAPMCASGRRHGLDTAACTMDELEAGADGVLRLGGRRVDAVFRLFLSFDQPDGPGLAALARAVQAGTVRMHTPEATWLLSDKTTLAWLWEDLGLLSEADRELVERHVPWTAVLTPGGPQEAAARDRTRLVLKPTGGYGGGGVVLGPEVSEERWRAALSEAAARGGHILQRYVAPDAVRMDFVHQESGAVQSDEVPFVLGPFLFGTRPSGVLVRHGVPGGGPVLNAHHGARLSGALLVDRAC